MSTKFLFKKTFFLFFSLSDFNNFIIRRRSIFAVLFILVDVLAVSLVPYCAKSVVDDLSINIYHTAWIAMGLLGLFWILEKTVTHIQDIIFFPVINKVIRNLSYKVVHHIHSISLPDYQKLSIPEVINCTRRISMSARSFMKICFLLIVPTLLKLIVAVTIVIKTNLFGLILLPALFVAFYLLYRGTRWYIKARGDAWQISDLVTSRINDSILNTKIIRQHSTFEMQAVGELLNTEAKSWQKANTRLHTIHVLIGALLGITITGILASSILAIQAGTLTVGDFVLLKGQLMLAFLPLRTFSTEFRQCAESLVDIRKIIQILDIPTEQNVFLQSSNAQPNSISLKNISFSHDTPKPVFDHLSLRINSGEKVAIVGESGSGKSTLINLIASLYKPAEGNIDVHQNKSFCIPQDFRLFNTTLRENITYGLLDISDFTILEIAKKTGLMALINQMPNGLDTLVGEMGIKLSGGEKQKVGLARALLLKPSILLLDETTSSLSVETEAAILSIIFSEIPTVILTSHRTALLQKVDRVIKIQNGKLYELKHSMINTEIYA